MLYVLLAIAVPANLLGIAAIVYGLRGRSTGVATLLAILTLLGAATTTSLAVFESAAVRRIEDNVLFDSDATEATRVRTSADATVRVIQLLGLGASILPWIGTFVCFARARRADD